MRVAPSFFGMRDKMVALVAEGRNPVWKKFVIPSMTYCPMIDQADL